MDIETAVIKFFIHCEPLFHKSPIEQLIFEVANSITEQEESRLIARMLHNLCEGFK